MKGNISEDALINTRKNIGAFLRKQREAQGLTQDALAERMDVSRSTISKVEDGKWNFGIDTLTLFAYHLAPALKGEASVDVLVFLFEGLRPRPV